LFESFITDFRKETDTWLYCNLYQTFLSGLSRLLFLF
jgi:hypothetical protein